MTQLVESKAPLLAVGRLLVILLFAIAVVFPLESIARDRIQVVGSSTVYPFATVVAEKLGRRNNIKTPVVESTGTGGGIKLFCGGVGTQYPDVTNASRAMKASEWEMCKKNGVSEVIEIVVGNDGIAFANSARSKKINVTKQQLWMAMAAKGPKPSKWSEIDASLPDTKIHIMIPPPTSGTRDAWNSLVMKKGCDPKVKEANSKECELMRKDGPVIEAGENDSLIVQKLAANPDAFGVFGFSYLDNNRDKIQAMVIDGVEISLSSIQDYSYPISRPLFFYAKKAHIGVMPGLKEYLVEFTGPAAISEDGYLADLGLVPLDSEQREEVRQTVANLTVMTKVRTYS